jgi:ethanolamine ammonia-lyase large subunit
VHLPRRQFVRTLIGTPLLGTLAWKLSAAEQKAPAAVSLGEIQPNEDVFGYIRRVKGKFDVNLYRQILGAANEFKEGDQAIGVAAGDEQTRTKARTLLANTRIEQFGMHPVFQDGLSELLASREHDTDIPSSRSLTFGRLKDDLLKRDEQQIKTIAATLSSDVIGCVVKLMSNEELIALGQKVFNPLPGSKIGAKGYLGARVQPNSPTDNLDDIRWQVFDAWAYAVGDVVLGTNPVSSDPESVAAVELALKDLLTTFGIDDLLPHCVLSHIDVQAEVERSRPGSTALWFQSIAGCDAANQTFDISLEKMLRYADSRMGKYGLYFETGQGADFTNGHSHGFDMVLHESRKYGFARVLKENVARAQKAAGKPAAPWVHLNDVAGFIGPEVFRTREQLVRCCLEDIVMGKLHGLCIGLDVCSTLHMDVSLDDLDWCLDQIMPANPAYLMALPTKIDPMLGYLTTGYQDHVRLREKFGYKVNDGMWQFFQELGVIDANGKPTEHFGDPLWVYLQYRHRKGDTRADEAILAEGRTRMQEIRSRGVFLAEGYGKHPGKLEPSLRKQIDRIYEDAKVSIWAELTPAFVANVPDHLLLKTQSVDREDYILHPTSGEVLSEDSVQTVRKLRAQHEGKHDVQIVISDGLNAFSIMDQGHLDVFLKTLRTQLAAAGYHPAKENLVVNSGRVRAGYRIGELLFADVAANRAILHIIGERPGTGHHTFSVYMTAPAGNVWGQPGKVDHNITKVVSGIATTALVPEKGAEETVRLLQKMAPM